MGDVVISRRWLVAAVIVAYVLVVSVAIDRASPVVAWAIGALGAAGLAGLALRSGRG